MGSGSQKPLCPGIQERAWEEFGWPGLWGVENIQEWRRRRIWRLAEGVRGGFSGEMGEIGGR